MLLLDNLHNSILGELLQGIRHEVILAIKFSNGVYLMQTNYIKEIVAKPCFILLSKVCVDIKQPCKASNHYCLDQK